MIMKENNFYLLIKEGFYSTYIFGFYDDFNKAKEDCDDLVLSDVDDWHTWMVIKLPEKNQKIVFSKEKKNLFIDYGYSFEPLYEKKKNGSN